MNRLLQELLFSESATRARRRHLLQACSLTLNAQDLGPLLDCIKGQPDWVRGLPLLAECANRAQVTELWQTWKSIEKRPPGVLELMGLHQIQEACSVAWQVALSGDWHEQCEAILCLANLEVESIASLIREKLDEMEGKALFLELLPSLAAKANWPHALERLRRWASLASTDCLGGIVTGISLCQRAEAEPIFEELLTNPRYEFYGGGTGLESFAEPAGRRLGRDLEWLIQRIRSLEEGPQRDHLLAIFLSWARVRLADRIDVIEGTPKANSCQRIFRLAFDWGPDPNEDQSLRRICPAIRRDTYSLLEKGFEQAAVHELILGYPI